MLLASEEKCASMFGKGWEKNEHQAYGSTQDKLNFALKECFLLLFCTQVVVPATRAHIYI